MSNSPVPYLKKEQIWSHVPEASDDHQAGVNHAHQQPLDETPAGETAQSQWTGNSPNKTGPANGNDP